MLDESQLFEPLPADVSALLDAERARLGPPPAIRERIYHRLALAIGLPGPGEPGEAGGTPSDAPESTAPPSDAGLGGASSAAQLDAAQSAAAPLYAALLKPAVLFAFAAGAAAGAGTMHLLHEGDGPASVSSNRASIAAAHQIGSAASSTVPRASPVAAPTPAASGRPALRGHTPATVPPWRAGRGDSGSSPRPARSATTATPERDERLAAERALVERARAALARGRPADALAHLAAHRVRFEAGQLVEEREALTALALTARGEYEAARRVARRLRQRFPQSLLLPVVQAALVQGKPEQIDDDERPKELR